MPRHDSNCLDENKVFRIIHNKDTLHLVDHLHKDYKSLFLVFLSFLFAYVSYDSFFFISSIVKSPINDIQIKENIKPIDILHHITTGSC